MGCTKIQSGIHTDNPICPVAAAADLLCFAYIRKAAAAMNWEGQRKSLHYSLQMWKLLWEKTFFFAITSRRHHHYVLHFQTLWMAPKIQIV